MTILSKVEIGVEYDVIEVEPMTTELIDDLVKTFGPQGPRWFVHGQKIYFRDPKDYFWFEMKW